MLDYPLDVLLIEDNSAFTRMLEYLFLSNSGPAVALTCATTMQDALQKLDQRSFDAIVTDLNLPDSAGAETYRTLLKHAAHTPVILLTGVDDEQLGMDAVKFGAQDYLQKNQIDGPELLKSIRYAIERHGAANLIHKLNTKLSKQNGQLSTLLGVGLELLNARELDPLLQSVAAQATGLFDADMALISLWTPPNQLIDRAIFPQNAEWTSSRHERSDEDPRWQVYDSGEALIVNEAPAWFCPDVKDRSIDACTFLVAPIDAKRGRLGTIALGRLTEKGSFDPSDIHIGSLFCEIVALVLENTRLYNEISHELEGRREAEIALAAERDLLHALMDNTPDFIYFQDPDLRFIRINAAYADHLELPDVKLAEGKSLSELQPNLLHPDRKIDDQQFELTDSSVDNVQLSRRPSGEPHWHSANESIIRDQGGQISGLIGITRDITDRVWYERRLEVQYRISRILEDAVQLGDAAPLLLQSICESLDWDMGEVWLVDTEIQELRLAELWHIDELDLENWLPFTRQRTFKQGDGFAGRVWAEKGSLWMADVMNHPGFPALTFAGQVGLHGAFGFPILVSGELLGVMTFFSRIIRPPDAQILQLFSVIAGQIGQFLERRRAEEALRRSEARLSYLIRRFVPREVAEKLVITDDSVRLGGEHREVSVIFADIRNYMKITRELEPPELMDLVNRYFGIIGRIILKHEGTINQYAGDMVMATFNAQDDQADHAARAVRTALEAQVALLDPDHQLASSPRVQFGIGVNTGMVVAGYVGFEDRFNFATLGDTINMAFRLSSFAQGGQVIIGEETHAQTSEYFNYKSLGGVNLKGGHGPMEIYEASLVRIDLEQESI
jgi:PAS domain S-box-containing protein